MFGKEDTVSIGIDYVKLAQEIHKVQLEHENKVTSEMIDPVGVITDELLENMNRHIHVERGLELTLEDVYRQRAMNSYNKTALWDEIMHKLNLPREAKYRMDMKTGEVFKLQYGFEELLAKEMLTRSLES